MMYCVDHNEREYSILEYEKLKDLCEHSGSYQCADDGKIRIYCFAYLDVACPRKSSS